MGASHRFFVIGLLAPLLAGCSTGGKAPPDDVEFRDFVGEAYQSGEQLKLCIAFRPEEANRGAFTRRARWYEGKLVDAASPKDALAKGCDLFIEELKAGLANVTSAYTGELLVMHADGLRASDDWTLAAAGEAVGRLFAPGMKRYLRVVADREAYRKRESSSPNSGP